MSMKRISALWTYRLFVLSSIQREFQSKYRNTLLGASWAVINPLLMIMLYTVIFSQVMHARVQGTSGNFAYSIYLCAGILSWNLFSEITSRAQTVFLENANLLKKINFPRLTLPVIVISNAAINFAIVFGLFSLFLLVSGNFPGLVYLALAPLLAILIAMAIGIGITLGILNVFFRDIGQSFGIIIQLWFWLTPIVYPVDILPPQIQTIVNLNPMTPLLTGFQTALVFGQWPNWEAQLYPALLALFLCGFGLHLFRRHSAEMIDEL